MLLIILLIFIMLISFSNKDCIGVILLNDFIWINVIISLLIFNIIFYTLITINVEKYTNINDENKILSSIGLCSKKCCPDYYNNNNNNNVIIDDRIKNDDIGKKYLTTSFSCNDGVRDKGCVCLNTKLSNENKNFLGTDK